MNAQLQPAQDGNFRLLIGGKLVAGASSFDVINPATEEVYARCPRADLIRRARGGERPALITVRKGRIVRVQEIFTP